MKKIYFSIFLFALSITGFSQSHDADIPQSEFSLAKPVKEASVQSNRAILWSEDFAGGFPAGWTLQNISGICPWRYSTDGSWGNFNGNGATAGGTAIASTSAANGFLICDPDSANHFVYGQPSGSTYQYLESYFTTSAIDLTGYPNVLLEFEQFFRFNNSVNLNVMVSTDLTTWTTWTVQGSTTNNNASPNAQAVAINISSVAGNQSTVYIRIGWNARVYYWMIDDMKISEAADNDLKIVNTNYHNQNPMSTGSTIKYTHVPTNQVAPVSFRGSLVNFGAQAQTNCNVNVNIVDAGMTNYYSGAGTAGNMNPGDSLHAVINAFTPAATVRDYNVIYNLTYANVASDASLENNSDTGWFKVTNLVYGRDNNTYSGGGLWNGAGDPYVMGNTYQIINSWPVNTVRVAFSAGTAVGVVVYAELYEIVGGNFNLVATSSGGAFEKTLASTDISGGGNIVWVDLQIPLTTLNAGGEYIVCVGHYGGPDDCTIMNGGTSQAQTSFLLDGTDNTWYYITSCPMIRIANTNIGIDENDKFSVSYLQNFPNPANGLTTFEFELKEESKIAFEITDISGKVVFTTDLGFKSAGANSFQLDLSNLASGVYHYSLTVGEQKISRKLIIAQ